MQYTEPTAVISLLAIVFGAWRIYVLSKLLQDARIDAASNAVGMQQWKSAHERCEESRDRLSNLFRNSEQARFELREQNKSQASIIDGLQEQIRDISISFDVERRVERRLKEMDSQITEAKGNGVRYLSRDANLGDKISKFFSINELARLCRFMDVEFENIPGETLQDKSVELVTHMRQRGIVDELLKNLRADRPKERWTW